MWRSLLTPYLPLLFPPASRDPALAAAAAERLGQEWNLPPQSEAALRNHIANALEPLSTFPTDGLGAERLVNIEVHLSMRLVTSTHSRTVKCTLLSCRLLLTLRSFPQPCVCCGQLDIRDEKGVSVFKDSIKWRAPSISNVPLGSRACT